MDFPLIEDETFHATNPMKYGKKKVKVKQSHYTPWRRLEGEEV
jgi:hypothetical protein